MNAENASKTDEENKVHVEQVSSDDDWELPGVACMLRPGMPGFDECEACQ